MKPRALLVGLILGATLSFSRAPAGLDPASMAVAEASDSALFRAGALAVCALVFLPSARLFAAGVGGSSLLAGCALGFGVHALSAPGLTPGSVLAWIAVLALSLAGAFALARRAPAAQAPPEPAPPRVVLAGWLLCGLGAATAFEASARPLRLMGGARALDDGLFALTLLAWMALGALAFAPLWARKSWSAPLAAAACALAAASCLELLGFLGLVSDRDALESFSRRFGIELSEQGMLHWDALLGARSFALPGLLAGAGLAALRARASWTALLAGAALAALLFPTLVRATVPGTPDSGTGLESLRELARLPGLRVAIGASLAGVGAGLAILGARGVAAAARASCAALALLAALLPWVLSRPSALPISPWLRFAIVPEFVRELPEGLLSVEPAPGPSTVVCLDRRRLTPLMTEQAGEDAQLEASLQLARSAQPRVLLMGPMTPARWVLLRGRGIPSVHRAWIGAEFAPQIESLLLGDLPPLPGESVPAAEWERVARDSELLIAPAVEAGGSAGLPRALDDFEGPAAVWIRAVDAAAEREWGSEVLLAVGRLQDLAIGLVQRDAGQAPGADPGFAAGESLALGAPWRRLRERSQERDFALTTASARRLARANLGTPRGPLGEALHELMLVQVRSSPYETPSQAVELPAPVIRQLREALLSIRSLGLFERRLVEFVAKTLSDKRELEILLDEIAPIAAGFAPWPVLERAVARADWELGDYEGAAARLELAASAAPYDLALGIWRAEALLRADRAAEAVQAWDALLQIQPGRHDLLRWRAIAMARAGDPGAERAISDVLASQPEDPLLRGHFQLQGPPPPLPPPLAGSLPGELPPAHPADH